MPDGYNPERWPDGLSLSVPFPFGRMGGTYYWNPGAPNAPRVTVNRSLGMPGAGLEAVFLAPGKSSGDTLGNGVSGNVSTIVPSVTLNGTFPDDGGLIRRPTSPRATSVGAGIGTFNMSPSLTRTTTPDQIADFFANIFAPPAMGPKDQVSPLERTLTSRLGTIAKPVTAPVGYLGSNDQDPLGAGMGDWGASTAPQVFRDPPQSSAPEQPGGLLGMIQDYMRNSGY
jgi:hypothetical protein